jgi:hypothetical protein
MNQLAIETLEKKLAELIDLRSKAIHDYNAKISALQRSILELGGTIENIPSLAFVYDDESPDYIKSSSVED